MPREKNNKNRHHGTPRLHGPLLNQQHYRCCKYASWSISSNYSPVGQNRLIIVSLLTIVKDWDSYYRCNVPSASWCGVVHICWWHKGNVSVRAPSSIPVPKSFSFLTDYFHTFTILIICCFFTIKAFTISEISSIGHLYDLVLSASKAHPVSGNQAGSYLTMTSKGVSTYIQGAPRLRAS